jgi:TIR domain
VAPEQESEDKNHSAGAKDEPNHRASHQRRTAAGRERLRDNINRYMARKKRCKVFVSYSRHDEALVKPLAGLLGVAANDAVFLDIDSIKPGDLWKTEIEEAVKACSVFVLCWCCESRRSEFVNHEINIALEDAEKRLVPVLFCPTPLPTSLASRQWINLQGRVVHVCDGHEVAITPAMTRSEGMAHSQPRRRSFTPLIFIVALITFLLLGILFVRRRPAPPEVTCRYTEGPRAGQVGKGVPIAILAQQATDRCTDEVGSTGFIVEFPTGAPEPDSTFLLLIVGAILTGGAFLSWWRRNRRFSESTELADRAAAYFEQLDERRR